MIAAPSGTIPGAEEAPAFQRSISPFQFGLFGFGSIVGTAWVVLLGGWLLRAGPAGTLLGIVAGGAAMALIAAMYAELGSRFPQTGGEVTYINAVFGKEAGFIVGWLLTLAYLSNLVFEGIALALLLEILWPPLAGPTLYVIFGQPIGVGELLLALASGLTIATLNYRGAHSFVRFQNLLTIAFLAIVFVAIGFELALGSDRNMQPLWQAGNSGSWLIGAVWVFGSVPMIFNGFQSVLQTIEERSQRTSKETVVRLSVAGVGAATLFYTLAVVGATLATPWVALASSGLPAADALAGLPLGRALRTAFLIALIASLLKAWNAVFMTSVRLLFAQSREGMIPAFFNDVNPVTGSPGKAVIVVASVNFVGIFLGKGFLDPIVNAMTVCIASIYVLICAATLVMRKRNPDHAGFQAWGGWPLGIFVIVAASGMVVFALLQPAPTSQADVLKWTVFPAWALLGLGLYLRQNRKPNSIMPNNNTAEAQR
jgi:amino acid transporter